MFVNVISTAVSKITLLLQNCQTKSAIRVMEMYKKKFTDTDIFFLSLLLIFISFCGR